MAKIKHYEVYVDRGQGWKLEERFTSEQRNEAFNLAKELEFKSVAVKIIQEVYDVQEGNYYEVVEYVSGLSNKIGSSGGGSGTQVPGASLRSPTRNYYSKPGEPLAVPSRGSRGKGGGIGGGNNARGGGGNNKGQKVVIKTTEMAFVFSKSVFFAIIKLIIIVLGSLFIANALLSLLVPLVESVIPDSNQKGVMFTFFFILFLAIAVPLLLKKVPWHVFMSQKVIREKVVYKKALTKAQTLIQRYNLNDEFDPSIAPSYPEASIEHKRYIVDFLGFVVSSLEKKAQIKDSFSKLGVKLVIYGGCLELCRFEGLAINHANSLLNESFQVIDGDAPDLEAFYEAKKSYKDNNTAILLTGVGAYLMAHIIKGKPMDMNSLPSIFSKWEALNKNAPSEEEAVEKDVALKEDEEESAFKGYFVVAFKNTAELKDPSVLGSGEELREIKNNAQSIIENLAVKIGGREFHKTEENSFFKYYKLPNALEMATSFFDKFHDFESELNDENLEIENKCVIIYSKPDDDEALNVIIEDILIQSYSDEIVVDKEVKEQNEDKKYDFDFLGNKKLHITEKTMELYKLIY